jgi:hypothetical protein
MVINASDYEKIVQTMTVENLCLRFISSLKQRSTESYFKKQLRDINV